MWNVVVSVFCCCVYPAYATFLQYDLPDDDYFVPGDINVGGVLSLSAIEPGRLCGKAVGKRYVQLAHAIMYGVEKVNNDPDILPNISLGFVLLNDCTRERVALSQSTKFIRTLQCHADGCAGATSGEGRRGKAYYNVVAQVGAFQSKFTVLVAALFSQHRQNVLGVATSNELSDTSRYKYFTRTTPPDSNRARAMVEVMLAHTWSYIANYGSQGSYGENGMAFVHKFAREKGMCIAYTKVLPPDFTEDQYDKEIMNLRKIGKVKVIALFMLYFHFDGFMRAIGRMNASAEFIFVGSEGLDGSIVEAAKENALNSISVLESIKVIEDFYDSYSSMNPFRNDSGNPWFGEYTEEELGCVWSIPEGQKGSCHNFKSYLDIPEFSLINYAHSFVDQVLVVAYAAQNLISESCPEAYTQKSLLHDCVYGEKMLEHIQKLQFQGLSMYFRVDENGDLLGKYDIMNAGVDDGVYSLGKVGEWNTFTDALTLQYEKVSFYTQESGGKVVIVDDVPESVCARPCNSGQFYIQGELKCCWECKYCRDNEIVRPDQQGCVTCGVNLWPEPVNGTMCDPIPPSFMQWDDPIAMGLVALNITSVFVVLAITIIFYNHRERKVVKGSNKELMVIIQMGLLIAYCSVFAYIVKPTRISCYINFFGFNVSCTMIFGPLLIKTNRLYRIFTAAEKCKTRVKRVDISSILVATFGIILTQVGISVGVAVYDPPAAIIQMPVRTKPHVELLCRLPLINLLTPLSFNLLLLLLCAVYGFLTRKLPDNFNESWYIFISVTTTLFVWIAFLPTYFLAFYSYHKAALLALALILNGAVTCLCLYSPKIYALYYIKEENIQVSSFDNTEFSKESSRH